MSWDGWIYLCHRFSKDPHDSDFCYGNLKGALAGTAKGYGEKVLNKVEEHRSGKPSFWRAECRGCVAQYGCEKGCMHSNTKCTGDINQPPKLYCEIRKEAAMIVTWLDKELRAVDSEWWARGNHLAKNLKHKTVASRLMTKAIETMISRSLDNYSKRGKRR